MTSLDKIDINEFRAAYDAIYSALYELDDGSRVNYRSEMEKTEQLLYDKSSGIQKFLKKFYAATYDVPTSDREYAAFWLALNYFGAV